jgi:sec-independent protein translocase protein TatA
MPQIGPFELVVILVIVIIFFGVGRLGEVGGALGKGLREFRKAASGEYDEKEKTESESEQPPTESK